MTKLLAFLLSAGFMAGQGMFPIPGGHNPKSSSWPNGYAIGREAYMTAEEVREWSDEIFSNPPEQINRRDASALIDALQRRRNKEAPLPPEGKDESVSVGTKAPAKPTPEDDSDLNF